MPIVDKGMIIKIIWWKKINGVHVQIFHENSLSCFHMLQCIEQVFLGLVGQLG